MKSNDDAKLTLSYQTIRIYSRGPKIFLAPKMEIYQCSWTKTLEKIQIKRLLQMDVSNSQRTCSACDSILQTHANRFFSFFIQLVLFCSIGITLSLLHFSLNLTWIVKRHPTSATIPRTKMHISDFSCVDNATLEIDINLLGNFSVIIYSTFCRIIDHKNGIFIIRSRLKCYYTRNQNQAIRDLLTEKKNWYKKHDYTIKSCLQLIRRIVQKKKLWPILSIFVFFPLYDF